MALAVRLLLRVAVCAGVASWHGAESFGVWDNTRGCRDAVGANDTWGDCATYQTYKWCNDGSAAPAWLQSWGAISASVMSGCCACGGGVKSLTQSLSKAPTARPTTNTRQLFTNPGFGTTASTGSGTESTSFNDKPQTLDKQRGVVPLPSLGTLGGARIFIGASCNYKMLFSNASKHGGLASSDVEQTMYGHVLASEFSITTPENSMKMKYTQAKQGVWDFKQGDAIMKFVVANNMHARAHNLVWVSHNPTWLAEAAPAMSNAQLKATMVQHIYKAIQHNKQFGQNIYSWDVVNEALDDVPATHICSKYECALKNKGGTDHVDWTRVGGPSGNESYVEVAFRTAARALKAPPSASTKLMYNDYAIHNADTDKFKYLILMLKDLVRKGVPIHGVGIQMHIRSENIHKAYDVAKFRSALSAIAAIGNGKLEVHVSELDVPPTDPMYEGLTTASQKQAKLATLYKSVLTVCLEFPQCKSFETWGMTDAHNSFVTKGADLAAPGAFYYNKWYRHKEARNTIARVLERKNTAGATATPISN